MKISKLVLGALSIMAVTSCVNDDIVGLGGKQSIEGKKTLTVELAEIKGYADTRAGFTYTAENVWQEGDKLRVYDEHIQMFEEFEYNSDFDIFTAPEGTEVKPEYVLFGENITYGGWSNGSTPIKDYKGLYAVMEMPATWDYELFGATNKEGKSVNGYLSNCPLFAHVTKYEDGKINSKGRLLAGILRIKITNGKGAIQRIEVSAEGAEDNPLAGTFDVRMAVDTEGNVTEEATITPSATLKGNSQKTLTIITENKDDKEDTNTNLSEKNSYVFVPIVPGEYEKLVIKYFSAESDKKGEVLRELKNVHSDAGEILYTLGENEERNYVSDVQIAFDRKAVNIKTPGALQREIEAALERGLDAVYDINDETTNITVGDEKQQLEYTTVVVPTMTNNITLNIKGGIVSESTGTDTRNKLIITSKEGATATDKWLTINYEKDQLAGVDLDITGYKGNIRLTTADADNSRFRTVNANVDGNLELNGKFSIGDDADATECAIKATKNVVLKGNFYNHALKVHADGNVDVAYENKGGKTYEPTLTIENADSVTIGEMPHVGKIEVKKSTKVTVNGNIDVADLEVKEGSVEVAENVTATSVAALNNAGVTLGKAAEVTAVSTYGSVTMGDGAKVITMTAKNSVTLGAGATVTNLTFTGVGTISKADEAATVADNDDEDKCDIETLTLDGEGAVTLNGVTIGDGVQEEVEGTQEKQNKKVLIVTGAKAIAGENLIVNGDIDASKVEEGTVAVATTKASAIYGNASANVTFTSTWDGESQLKAYGPASSTKIYTAAQFANLNQKNGSATYYANLMTDVDLDGNELPLNLTVTNKPWGLYGNGHNINNVALEGNENVGFFGVISNTSTSTVTIKDLNINIKSYTVESSKAVSNVGLLVGQVVSENDSKINIENVNVSGTGNLGSAVKESKNIGGLIGLVDGAKVALSGNTIKVGTIAGHYNLGGTIGSMINGANVEVKTSPNTVTAFNVWAAAGKPEEMAEREKYGTVGMVVGSIAAGDNKPCTLTLGEAGSTFDVHLYTKQLRNSDDHKKALHFDYNYKFDSVSGKEQVYVGGNASVGFSKNIGQSTITYLGSTREPESFNAYK